MDERLQELMLELGAAINETLSDSDRIGAAVAAIRKAGYDTFLVLEATIGFSAIREETNEEPETPKPDSSSPNHQPQVKIQWNRQDKKFLKALRISPGDEPAV